MSLPREPFDWAGPDDEPIFLGALPSEPPRSGEAPSVLVTTEDVVRGAQEAISRHDTDPSISTPSPLPAFQGATASGLMARSFSRRTLALLLTMSCGLAFAHGWITGARARPDSHSRPCDADHC